MPHQALGQPPANVVSLLEHLFAYFSADSKCWNGGEPTGEIAAWVEKWTLVFL